MSTQHDVNILPLISNNMFIYFPKRFQYFSQLEGNIFLEISPQDYNNFLIFYEQDVNSSFYQQDVNIFSLDFLATQGARAPLTTGVRHGGWVF